jgi:hypothetical protein
MVKRRKMLIGMGSLAAGGAAAMGTGAFTSVSAKRSLEVQVADDSDALLALVKEDSANADAYVTGQKGNDPSVVQDGDTLSIDISTDQDPPVGGVGVNNNAYTVIRRLFEVKNQGSQAVYVWAEGLPSEVRMFTDDTNYLNRGTGAGNNQGAFSDTSNLNPADPADTNDPANPGGYEAAPLLDPGQGLDDIGMLVDTRGGSDLDFDSTIIIKAVAPSEL